MRASERVERCQKRKGGEDKTLMKKNASLWVTISVFVKRQVGSEVSKTFAPKETSVGYEKNLQHWLFLNLNRSDQDWRRTTFLRS